MFHCYSSVSGGGMWRKKNDFMRNRKLSRYARYFSGSSESFFSERRRRQNLSILKAELDANALALNCHE